MNTKFAIYDDNFMNIKLLPASGRLAGKIVNASSFEGYMIMSIYMYIMIIQQQIQSLR